jgi:hypothetical protein
MSSLSRFIAGTSSLCVALAAGGCGKADRAAQAAPAAPPVTGTVATTLPPEARAALDAGNAAYRAKRMDVALADFRAAAVAAPTHAAPWFGVYMVAGALNNTALADSAMVHVKALSQDAAVLDAHAKSAADPTTLPPGHPSATALPPGHPVTPTLPPGHPATPPSPHPTSAPPRI